jgi:hypothetical protein
MVLDVDDVIAVYAQMKKAGKEVGDGGLNGWKSNIIIGEWVGLWVRSERFYNSPSLTPLQNLWRHTHQT